MAEYIEKKAVMDWLAAKKQEAEDNSNEESWEYRNVAASCEYDGQKDAFEETETFINSLPAQGEWSKEDEEHREWILECLADGARKVPEYADQYQAAFDWLRNLRKPIEAKPEVDLDDEINKYIDKHFHIRYDETLEVGNDPLTTHDFVEAATHFYNLNPKHKENRPTCDMPKCNTDEFDDDREIYEYTD